MATLGYIGERLDLLIRQGATFGPFDVTLANPDKTPVDLTGAGTTPLYGVSAQWSELELDLA